MPLENRFATLVVNGYCFSPLLDTMTRGTELHLGNLKYVNTTERMFYTIEKAA